MRPGRGVHAGGVTHYFLLEADESFLLMMLHPLISVCAESTLDQPWMGSSGRLIWPE